jgi:hypothetical protein
MEWRADHAICGIPKISGLTHDGIYCVARREVFTYLGETSSKSVSVQFCFDVPLKSSLPSTTSIPLGMYSSD